MHLISGGITGLLQPKFSGGC